MGASNTPNHTKNAVPSPSEYFISAKYVRTFLSGAVLQGYDPLKIIKKAGLSTKLYTAPCGQLNGTELHQLIMAISEEMNDYFIGFMELPPPKVTAKSPPLIQAQHETFEEALREAILYSEIIRSDTNCNYYIDLKRQECIWSIWYQLRKDVDARLFYWFRLMTNYKLFCSMTNKRIELSRVCFTFPPPEPDEGIDYSIFGCEVLFNQPINALVFHRKYLLLPILYGITQRLDYQNWFALPGKSENPVKQVEDTLVKLQDKGIWSPTITTVAKELAIKPRALRRLLARENETFLKVRNRIRCEAAVKLLVTTNMPLAEIATQIGFAEPGDFTRAFKAWTGVTPSTYRAKHSQTHE